MPDISPPRIAPISDTNSGPQDQPAKKPRAKPAPPEKPAVLPVPKVSTPDDEDKHELDEMA